MRYNFVKFTFCTKEQRHMYTFTVANTEMVVEKVLRYVLKKVPPDLALWVERSLKGTRAHEGESLP